MSKHANVENANTQNHRKRWLHLFWVLPLLAALVALSVYGLGIVTFLKVLADASTAGFGIFGLLNQRSKQKARNRKIALIGICVSFVIASMTTILDSKNQEREALRIARPFGDMEIEFDAWINLGHYQGQENYKVDTYVTSLMDFFARDHKSKPDRSTFYKTTDLPTELREYPSWVTKMGDVYITIPNPGTESCGKPVMYWVETMQIEVTDNANSTDDLIEWRYSSGEGRHVFTPTPSLELIRKRKLVVKFSSPQITSVEDIPRTVVGISQSQDDNENNGPYHMSAIYFTAARGSTFTAFPSSKYYAAGLNEWVMTPDDHYCVRFTRH